MSRQKIRIVFLFVIGAVILAGIFATVQAASSSAGVARGHAQVTAGLLPDLSHPRNVTQPLDTYEGGEDGHGCHEEGINPSDY